MSECAAEIRRYRRLATWNYAQGASLFITVATEPRKALFGVVAEGKVALSPLGKAVEESLLAMPRLNDGLSLFGHVVMPDHVHFNVHLAAGLPEPLMTLGNAIRRFKNYTNKQAKLNLAIKTEPPPAPFSSDGRTLFGQFKIWQQGYHDMLCPTRAKIEATERYIAYNPLKWELMHGAGGLRIFEPLSSPRLDPEEYLKGVGNPALLSAEGKLVSLRVSRKVRDIAAVVERMEKAADQGYTVISGFVSKGEQAVRDALCRKPGARLIHLRASCIPNARFKPESAYVQAFAEGRCLELGRGNEEIAFGRAACLDVNAEIVEMAKSGPGYALYFKREGLVML